MKIIKFRSKNCAACDALDKALKDGLDIYIDEVIDVEEQPEKARLFGVVSVPALVVYKYEDRVQAVLHGFHGYEKTKAFLEKWGK